MYAIIETGGKQYKVREGETVDVELLGGEAGDTIELDQVLLVAGHDGSTVGVPTVEGAVVQATVLDKVKGDKVVVFKYKPKNRYRVKTGHRQKYTRLQIDRIIVPGAEYEEGAASDLMEETPAVEMAEAETPEPVEAVAEVEAPLQPETAAETAAEQPDEPEEASELMEEALAVEMAEAETPEPVEAVAEVEAPLQPETAAETAAEQPDEPEEAGEPEAVEEAEVEEAQQADQADKPDLLGDL